MKRSIALCALLASAVAALAGTASAGKTPSGSSTGTATVFFPNPVAQLQDQSLTDRKDADYAALQPAYRTVTLTDLDGGGFLVGRWAQVERFAPGFRALVLARHTIGPAGLEAHNRNLVGGDLAGGAMDLSQLVFRPARKLVPYRTPLPGVYLCSASTPPGGGVHGMCGYSAARAALADLPK
jgi:phytoene dehydrogenase-like protein